MLKHGEEEETKFLTRTEAIARNIIIIETPAQVFLVNLAKFLRTPNL